MKFVTLDIQGFTIADEFVAKELGIYTGTKTAHFIFKPPQEYSALSTRDKKSVSYLERHHHGLRYSDGYVNYEEINSILTKYLTDVNIVYVKGCQKYNFIVGRFNEIGGTFPLVLNVELSDCNPPVPNLERKIPICMSHTGRGHKSVVYRIV
ncbi:hypothetical protein WA026_020714 [Henosepilachna vigintioctopunctata]|uniref:Uncharacterized protein n=1 Tax=Henosepilachna vigintioctopunctata TaxID=420089 RepID=A0AAW1UBM5_9CUCU